MTAVFIKNDKTYEWGGKVENKYSKMDRKELIKLIYKKKNEFAEKVCILEHNFQLDDLLQFADIVGDTSSLLNKTMETKAEYLVYTGAKFFTEAGAILCPQKRIIQVNMKADCPLTYLVDENLTEKMFDKINKKHKNSVIPICYFTASYKLKSFCGRNSGVACTASCAQKIIEYYFERGKTVFFTPMSNIAFNIVNNLKLSDNDIVVIDENFDVSSITGKEKMYIWDIGCYVHSAFSVKDIKKTRNKYNNIKIIAHLECLPEVIANCDFGSFTDGVYDIIRDNPKQNIWGLATVSNFAYRLAKQYKDKTIIPICPDLFCEDMTLTDLPHLAESLESIADYKNGKGKLKTELKVPEEYRKPALKAIYRMYDILKINIRKKSS